MLKHTGEAGKDGEAGDTVGSTDASWSSMCAIG